MATKKMIEKNLRIRKDYKTKSMRIGCGVVTTIDDNVMPKSDDDDRLCSVILPTSLSPIKRRKM